VYISYWSLEIDLGVIGISVTPDAGQAVCVQSYSGPVERGPTAESVYISYWSLKIDLGVIGISVTPEA
jgi:hypothetical protein